MKDEKKSSKLEFIATKQYLSKLSEKYKNRGYEKVFLENDSNYLWEVKEVIKQINWQNELLDDIIYRQTNNIQKISKLDKIDSKLKKRLTEENIYIFSEITTLLEMIIENEWLVMKSIDRFRKIEKKIDAKTKTLTKFWFDKELEHIFDNLIQKKHKELTVIVFDMNNLKTINESFWHQTGSESIYKFGNILRDELDFERLRYALSNYFWWDEWFLAIADCPKNKIINLVKRFFNTIKNNTYDIRENKLNLSACAWIAHFHLQKNQTETNINPKILLQIADTLVLKSKIQKNRNKSWNAYKALNVTNFTLSDIKTLTKEVQIKPVRLNKKTLSKKKLIELFEIRRKQNEKIMRARTLWEKKILRFNLDSINEVIWQKIIESITKTLEESKKNTLEKIPQIWGKAIRMAIKEIERNIDELWLSEEMKELIADKIIKSSEFNNYMKSEISTVYDNDLFQMKN